MSSSILPIYRTQTGTLNPGQRGTGSNGNEVVLQIPLSSKTVASPSDAV